jgi:hypothetical protein
MEWQEFAPGDAVPEVVSETGEDGTGGETEGDPSDTINVAKDTEINGAVLFQPLPYVTNVFQDGGLFDSNGVDSKYLFQQKAPHIFDESECAAACGT